VADREFVFSNPDVQKLLREKFIPLAMDDWYLRRQNEENGKFYMAMTEASPRGGAGDNTRQGRYVFTATGKFLGFNNNRGPDRILPMLRQSLSVWDKLPPAERKPPGEIGPVKPEARFFRPLPQNGAVVKVYTRVLEKKPDGSLSACTVPADTEKTYEHRGFDAAIDHLWLREEDVKRLIPGAGSKQGAAIPFPAVVAQRIARFHLTDNTRGEPPHWSRDEVKKAEFFLTPESATRAKLSGVVHLETKDGKRGFTGTLDGWLEHRNGKLTDLRAAVAGDNWGDSALTRGARPGRTPIGFALVLCPDPKAADRVPPQASRWLEGYYEPDRN
jgi:hypothetical protein